MFILEQFFCLWNISLAVANNLTNQEDQCIGPCIYAIAMVLMQKNNFYLMACISTLRQVIKY